MPTLGGSAIWQIGEPMPSIQALAPDGNPLDMNQLTGKIIVMSFWTMSDANTQKHFDLLREIRKEFITAKQLQMINFCMNAEWSHWLKFLERQKPYDENFSDRPLYSDSRCWQMYYQPSSESQSNPFGARNTPKSFVIDTGGKFLAVNVTDEKLQDVVRKAMDSTLAK